MVDVLGDPILPVPEEKLHWWLDKVKIQSDHDGDLEKLSDSFQYLIDHFRNHREDWIAVHSWKMELNKFGGLCKQYGYSFKRVVSLLENTIQRLERRDTPIARVFRELPKLVSKAEEQTRRNRRLRIYKGTSSFGLFQCKLNDLVKAEKATWKK